MGGHILTWWKSLSSCLNKTSLLTLELEPYEIMKVLGNSLSFPGKKSHYQKINKYKRKYRENISVGKFTRDFTDGNILSVYTEGITVGKKFKTKQKKLMTCHFLPTELPTEFFTNRITVVNSLVNCEHCSSCQLQRELPTEFSVGIFQRAPELFTFQLHY